MAAYLRSSSVCRFWLAHDSWLPWWVLLCASLTLCFFVVFVPVRICRCSRSLLYFSFLLILVTCLAAVAATDACAVGASERGCVELLWVAGLELSQLFILLFCSTGFEVGHSFSSCYFLLPCLAGLAVLSLQKDFEVVSYETVYFSIPACWPPSSFCSGRIVRLDCLRRLHFRSINRFPIAVLQVGFDTLPGYRSCWAVLLPG